MSTMNNIDPLAGHMITEDGTMVVIFTDQVGNETQFEFSSPKECIELASLFMDGARGLQKFEEEGWEAVLADYGQSIDDIEITMDDFL